MSLIFTGNTKASSRQFKTILDPLMLYMYVFFLAYICPPKQVLFYSMFITPDTNVVATVLQCLAPS